MWIRVVIAAGWKCRRAARYCAVLSSPKRSAPRSPAYIQRISASRKKALRFPQASSLAEKRTEARVWILTTYPCRNHCVHHGRRARLIFFSGFSLFFRGLRASSRPRKMRLFANSSHVARRRTTTRLPSFSEMHLHRTSKRRRRRKGVSRVRTEIRPVYHGADVATSMRRAMWMEPPTVCDRNILKLYPAPRNTMSVSRAYDRSNLRGTHLTYKRKCTRFARCLIDLFRYRYGFVSTFWRLV